MRDVVETSVAVPRGVTRVRVGLVARPGVGTSILSRTLSATPDIQLVSTSDSVERASLLTRSPDVWLCEAGFDAEALGLMRDPRPVLVFSWSANRPGGCTSCNVELPARRAELETAFAFLAEQLRTLGMSTRAARRIAKGRPSSIVPPVAGAARRLVIAIGASTGGPAMIQQVLSGLPPDSPPVVVAQHIGPSHIPALIRQLGRAAALRVVEAKEGVELEPGFVYVAPGDRHARVERARTGYRIKLDDGPRVHGHKPSVDVLFSSLATAAGSFGVGVVMTGMGVDGADGLLAMRLSGAATIAQESASCVADGMPMAAIEAGAADRVASLPRLSDEIIGACQRLFGRKYR